MLRILLLLVITPSPPSLKIRPPHGALTLLRLADL